MNDRARELVEKFELLSNYSDGGVLLRVEINQSHATKLIAAFEAEVQRETREKCAQLADGFTCGICGMDGKAGAAIRALLPTEGGAVKTAGEKDTRLTELAAQITTMTMDIANANARIERLRENAAMIHRELLLVGVPGKADSEIPDDEPLRLSMGWIRKLRVLTSAIERVKQSTGE